MRGVRRALGAAFIGGLMLGDVRAQEDPPEVAIGERLFLETRFAQFFAASGGDVNAPLAGSDPVVETTETTTAPLPGPFAGASVNCRSCHLVDEHAETLGGGNRAYADFARRSPLPSRDDGVLTAARNSPALVNATLPRDAAVLHLDGEFDSLKILVKKTLIGRNYGWLPNEGHEAKAHIARVIREDDGSGDLAQEFGGAYRVLLAGASPSIPEELRLPESLRIDVTKATDAEIVNRISRIIAAYVESLVFATDEGGSFAGSPFDAFLRKNGLPTTPAPGESDTAYSARLRLAIASLSAPAFVGAEDGELRLHSNRFAFGAKHLRGLRVFLTRSDTPGAQPGRVGNCVSCHPAPTFTDFAFHNTGITQAEYDAVHGAKAFAKLAIPSLDERSRSPETFLPATRRHPTAGDVFRSPASPTNPRRTDLGLWNVFANPDFPRPQDELRTLLCGAPEGCSDADLLPATIARFKTPGLRDLGHSGPYFHDGRAVRIKDVVQFYSDIQPLAAAGNLRNGAPELVGISLDDDAIGELSAFLKALNEDYE